MKNEFVTIAGSGHVYRVDDRLMLHWEPEDSFATYELPIYSKPNPRSNGGLAYVAYLPIEKQHNKTINVPVDVIIKVLEDM